MRTFPRHTQAREDLVDGRQGEVACRRAGWERLGVGIQVLGIIGLLLPGVNGVPEAVEDGFHSVRNFGVGGAVDGILKEPTREYGVSEE